MNTDKENVFGTKTLACQLYIDEISPSANEISYVPRQIANTIINRLTLLSL